MARHLRLMALAGVLLLSASAAFAGAGTTYVGNTVDLDAGPYAPDWAWNGGSNEDTWFAGLWAYQNETFWQASAPTNTTRFSAGGLINETYTIYKLENSVHGSLFLKIAILSGEDSKALGYPYGDQGGARKLTITEMPNGDIEILVDRMSSFGSLKAHGLWYSTDFDGFTFDNAAFDQPAGTWTKIGGFVQTDPDYNKWQPQPPAIIPVPEPASLSILLSGLFGLAGFARVRMR